MLSKESTPFFYLLLIVFVFLFGGKLFTQGLFVDGIFYGSVAQSLADGYGSLWHLSATKHYYYSFYGHPPFAIWAMSSFMIVFDSAFWVERVFSLLNLGLMLWGVAKIWQLTNPNLSFYTIWWPILLWCCIPVNIWSFQGYLLENSMLVFVVWAVFWGIKTILTESNLYAIICGIFVFFATFSKGPVGLFPLAVIPLYWVVSRDLSLITVVRLTLIIFLSALIPYIILFGLSTDAVLYYSKYFQVQILGSFREPSIHDNGHFYILKTLLIEPIFLWGLAIFTFIMMKKNKLKFNLNKDAKKWFSFFILLTLAGTLPIVLSPKQMRFYITPAMPFLALAIGHYSFPFARLIMLKWEHKPSWHRPFFYLKCILLISAIGISINNYGKCLRDKALINDITTLTKVIPPQSKIILKTKTPAYRAECYFMRIGKICVNDFRWGKSNKAEKANPTPFLVAEKILNGRFYRYKKDTTVNAKLWDLYRIK
ncbi:MAG: hypothetical protein MK207_07160 [Saprospiraceae bacterium]|nr:hypothetical protein [Saprospiraceae bacterium]